MFDFRTSPGSPDCRGEGSFPVCRLSRSGRRSVGSDYSQCLGGHVARNRRTRTTFEPRPGHACAQGVATQVPHGGDRLDAHSLSRETGPRQKGNLYTLAITRVEYDDSMKEVLQRLLAIVRRRGVKIRFLLLDKGFFSVEVICYLRRAGHGFILPAVVRGRKPKDPKTPPHGLRALLKKKNGYYRETITSGQTKEKKKTSVTVNICVASKYYTHEETGRRRRKRLLYVVSKVRRTPEEIRETYRKRFGIETSYRQMNEAKIKTCTRDPRLRLLFVGIALVLRNVWVWIHFRFAKGKYSNEPRLFLELLRFQEMLLWITQIVQQTLGADKTLGLDRHTYERLTAHCQT